MQLHFITGTMGSAKTLNLMQKHWDFSKKSAITTLLGVPSVDTRQGVGRVKSRAMQEPVKADFIIQPDSEVSYRWFLEKDPLKDTKWILLLDEVQFLTPKTVDSVRRLVDKFNVEVFAYGLRTDFQSNLFAGSKRLLEVADTIKLLPSTCEYCLREGIFNLRLGKTSGPQVLVGGDDMYKPACSCCYREEMGEPTDKRDLGEEPFKRQEGFEEWSP